MQFRCNCLHTSVASSQKVMIMAMTIYDISQKAGVSIATVSRVINGSGNVKASTQQKVMDIIRKYDYTPNAYARGMGLNSIRTVGILCADCSDLYLAKAVYLLEQDLQANGYEALLCCTGYNPDARKNYLNLILSKKVDSIILVGSNFIAPTEVENAYIAEAAEQVPIMLLNASYDHPNVYSTLCDDHAAMYEAASAMLDAGIHRILYLYNSNSYSGTRKRKGIEDALKNAGITDIQTYVRFYSGKIDQLGAVIDFIGQIADSGVVFDGVIASEDSLAIGAVKYARCRGLCVPRDFSVIGCNNSILTDCCTPELTSIDNRLETLSHQLVQTLLDVIHGEEVPKKAIFSGKLIKRSTTNF